MLLNNPGRNVGIGQIMVNLAGIQSVFGRNYVVPCKLASKKRLLVMVRLNPGVNKHPR